MIFLRGKIGQHFWAGAEGRKVVLGRLRAAAVGRFFLILCPLSIFGTFCEIF